MPFDEVAATLNQFLTPIRLEETDRFDEVPGFVAEVSPATRFVLQGAPLDLPSDAPRSERFNLFYFRCSENEIELLPPILRDLPRSAELGQNGYANLNSYLLDKLRKSTRLQCTLDG